MVLLRVLQLDVYSLATLKRDLKSFSNNVTFLHKRLLTETTFSKPNKKPQNVKVHINSNKNSLPLKNKEIIDSIQNKMILKPLKNLGKEPKISRPKQEHAKLYKNRPEGSLNIKLTERKQMKKVTDIPVVLSKEPKKQEHAELHKKKSEGSRDLKKPSMISEENAIKSKINIQKDKQMQTKKVTEIPVVLSKEPKKQERTELHKKKSMFTESSRDLKKPSIISEENSIKSKINVVTDIPIVLNKEPQKQEHAELHKKESIFTEGSRDLRKPSIISEENAIKSKINVQKDKQIQTKKVTDIPVVLSKEPQKQEHAELHKKKSTLTEGSRDLKTPSIISEENVKINIQSTNKDMQTKKVTDIHAVTNLVTENDKESESIISPGIENQTPQRARFEIGDYVELRRNDKSYSGIVVKLRTDPTSMGKNHILLPNGHTIAHRDDDVVFTIPRFAYIKKLGDTLLAPESPIPSNYGKIAGDLSKSALILLQSRILEFRQVYSHFAPADDTELRTLTVNDVACHVFKTTKPENSQTLATILFLIKENIYFITDTKKLRDNGTFRLRAKVDIQAIAKVMEWIRLRDPKFTEFQSKAITIVNYKRSLKTKENDHTISSNRIKELPNFTEDDKLFINFFKSHIVGFNAFDAQIAAILKPTKLYDCDLDKDCAIKFLKDIGVWTPWENLNVYDPTIMLNGHGVSRKADSDHETSMKLANNLMKTKPFVYNKKVNSSENGSNFSKVSLLNKTLPNLGPNDFYPYDICENIRHDFGDLPVYTVDDHTAHELDDGISIERLDSNKSEPSSTWVHVHIADPSSVIHPSHQLSQIALSRVQSVYFPDRNYAMIPPSLSEKRFSLGTDAGINGNSVMSFSVRIGDDGNILDYQVRAGIVRNVKCLYYDDVDTILSWENIGGSKEEIEFVHKQLHYHPKPIPPPINVYKELPESSKRDLRELQKISFMHMKNRINIGAINMGISQPAIQISPFPLPSANPSPQGPISYLGTPTIQVQLDKSMHSPARAMVAEYMILAGVVAAKFCKERNIPTLYRKQLVPNSPIVEEEKKYKDMRNGVIPLTSVVKMRPLMTAAELSTESGPHWAMGIADGYSKVTSPLRRYCDILVHWQMKASLLGTKFPFSKEELENMTQHIRTREKEISRTQVRSEKFWILSLFERFMKSNTMPELTAVTVDVLEKGDKTVLLREFGIQGRFSGPEGGEIGNIIKVKPLLIHPNKVNLNLGPA